MKMTGVRLLVVFFVAFLCSACFRAHVDYPPRVVRLHPGQTKTLAPSSVSPGTLVVCPHRGGVHVGPSGTGTGNSAGVSTSTLSDGTVIANCEGGPPPNA